MTRIEELIEALELRPHPEGGYYAETYRSVDCVSEGRSIVTAIYYLLPANAVSRLHRIDADELWFFHEGQPLHVHVFEGDRYERLTLGPATDLRQRPQHLVRKGAWFGAHNEHASGFSLVSCVVAPGFEFKGFELAEQAWALSRWPEQASLLKHLTVPQEDER
ncbi:MAG: cupin domain-containing protein [Bradymonadia bacterium]